MLGRNEGNKFIHQNHKNSWDRPTVHFDLCAQDLTDPSRDALLRPRLYRQFDPYQNIPNPRVTGILRSPDQTIMERRHSTVKEALPFGRAMKTLYDHICHAEQIFQDFQAQFENDIAGIRRYADDSTLNKLWKLRVHGRKDPDTLADGEDREDDETLREMSGKLEDVGNDLVRAMTTATNSLIRERRDASSLDKARAAEANRMKQKVALAYELIQTLLIDFGGGRHQCNSLLSELSSLKYIIDPSADQNRVLFRTPSDIVDDEDGISMTCNDGRKGWE